MVRRRALSTVEVPTVLTDAVEAAAAASRSGSTKSQRRETLQLTDSLKQMSRTPGRGGTAMTLTAANASSSAHGPKVKRVTLSFSADCLTHSKCFGICNHCEWTIPCRHRLSSAIAQQCLILIAEPTHQTDTAGSSPCFTS